jgi:hypothetical protein
MENDSNKTLESIRKGFSERRNRLRILQNEFDRLSKTEKEDDFKRMSFDVMEDYASYMIDIYTRLEEIWISNFALKDQFELLKDIVIQLPDVKNNPQILQDIEKLFKKYDKSY